MSNWLGVELLPDYYYNRCIQNSPIYRWDLYFYIYFHAKLVIAEPSEKSLRERYQSGNPF